MVGGLCSSALPRPPGSGEDFASYQGVGFARIVKIDVVLRGQASMHCQPRHHMCGTSLRHGTYTCMADLDDLAVVIAGSTHRCDRIVSTLDIHPCEAVKETSLNTLIE
jgi:hypothetical protein